MKLLQSLKPINLIAFRREFVNFYSTVVKDSLYRRISPVGDPNISVTPLLDQWVLESGLVQQDELRHIIKELRVYKRFKHALEISKWMSDKRYFPLSTADIATRMNLILRVHGLEQVEDYFNNMPSQLKRCQVHIALLNCYAHEKYADKANAVLQKIKEMGFAKTSLPYNITMNLYHQIGEFERLDSPLKETDVDHDQFTYTTRLSAYATAFDFTGIEKIMEQME
ncbi:pentatricopeptide repeat-containing protein At2g20710, mitochondrial-like [Cucumis sativus]|uniref:pentatricopeptide repeat-containing protein At2g20710, mitochondrial-like n=1 Tax=Cucumis sativus TaxID=3659 RepID=UPI0012F525BF|nr:pentatricopeptide repeat-containing protein At2g20710, mitochondrial-like [Cucumis sativus]